MNTWTLSATADYWLRQRNVEVVWCRLPSLEEVESGTHSVFAVGNDGTGVQMFFDTEAVRDAEDDIVVLTQFGYIGRALQRMRFLETEQGYA